MGCFFHPGKLKKISVDGGAASPCATRPMAVAAVGARTATSSRRSALLAGFRGFLPPEARPRPSPTYSSGEATHRWPQILPGGKAVLFTASTDHRWFDAANIEVMSLADHRRKTLVRGGTFGRYLPSGHLVYVNRGTLFAVPFDPDRLEVHGTPAPVLDKSATALQTGSAQLDFSQTGTLIYRAAKRAADSSPLQWLDGAGKPSRC